MTDIDLLAKAVTWMDRYATAWFRKFDTFFPTVGMLVYDDPAGGDAPRVLLCPVLLVAHEPSSEMTEDLERGLVRKLLREVRKNPGWGQPRVAGLLTPTAAPDAERATHLTMFLGSLTHRHNVVYQAPMTWRDRPGAASTLALAGAFAPSEVDVPPLFVSYCRAVRGERSAVVN